MNAAKSRFLASLGMTSFYSPRHDSALRALAETDAEKELSELAGEEIGGVVVEDFFVLWRA